MTEHEQHPNSRKITIFRAGSFLSRAQGSNADAYFASSNKSIGSYFENCSSPRVASGLSFSEEDILLPLILPVPSTDKEFRKEVSKFYVDITTKVPYSKGIDLEVGLTTDNKAPISETNKPIALMDYLRYRHALKHPAVAKTKEDADGNGLIEFYIFDASEALKKTTKKTEEKDAAFEIYLSIKPDEKKVTMMLTLLGIDPREFTGANKMDEMTAALRTQAETNPTRFIETYKNTDLEVHYHITTMVNTGVLKVVGLRYVVAETNKLLGNTLEETTFYFKDETNSDMVSALKAQNQEHMKKAIPKKRGTIKR